MRNFGKQVLSDHDFMNRLRACKGGEKLAIMQGKTYLEITVERKPHGRQIDAIWINEAERLKEYLDDQATIYPKYFPVPVVPGDQES